MRNQKKIVNPITKPLEIDYFEEGRCWITQDGEPIMKVCASDKEYAIAQQVVMSVNSHEDFKFEMQVYCKEVEQGKINGEKDYYQRFKKLLEKIDK